MREKTCDKAVKNMAKNKDKKMVKHEKKEGKLIHNLDKMHKSKKK